MYRCTVAGTPAATCMSDAVPKAEDLSSNPLVPVWLVNTPYTDKTLVSAMANADPDWMVMSLSAVKVVFKVTPDGLLMVKL